MNRLLFVFSSLIILSLLGGCEKKQASQPGESDPNSGFKAPAFTLTDQQGASFSSEQLHGKPWLVSFIFTTCPTICPEVTRNLVAIQDSLQDRMNPDHIAFVSVTVDPATDTASRLREYADQYGANHDAWKFLTGERASIWRLSKDGFRLPVAAGQEQGEGIISHSSKVMLFGDDSVLIGVYEGTSEEEMTALEGKLHELLEAATRGDPGPMARIDAPDEFEETARWMKTRQAGQLATRDQFDVAVDFKFTDRQPESGLDFRHHIVDCAGRDYKASHYDHGNGIAIADIDGDGLLDVYLVSQAGPCGLYRNLGKGKFSDVTDKAGVAAAESIGATASFADVDNDGDPDLYLTNVRSPNQLFLNKGDGTFDDVSGDSGIDYNEHSSAAIFFDYDNDGQVDLFLCVIGEYTGDERRKVDGTPSVHPIEGPSPEYYVAYEDAFAGHLKPERHRTSRLYRNVGNGKFKDVTESLGLVDKGWTGSAIPVDFNLDGYQDLYLLNMQGSDSYWENREGKGFVNRTQEVFPVTPWGAMSAKNFDYNNDGHLDLYMTDMHSDMSLYIEPELEKKKAVWVPEHWGEKYLGGGGPWVFGNAFFRNKGDGDFEEVSDELNMENYWPWGLSTGDLNADGWQDVFVASSMNYPFRYGINTLLINNAGGGFKDAEFILGIEPRREGRMATPWFQLDGSGAHRDHPMARGREGMLMVWGPVGSRSSAIFDVDNDGDLDIITNEFGDVSQVLISDLASATRELNYVKIKLRGTRSNRDALGARVTVKSGPLTQIQVHNGQSGYLSQSSMPLYFGLGENRKIDAIEVKWPSGAFTTHTDDLRTNDTLEVVEPGDPG
ncbi:MAG: redoxin domain-containing protein [Akkermansiaceae bacterium]|nr:redoxin domain-containing protein [Akkermansiaceae bacterium]